MLERFPGRERVVELGCGTGRVILEIAEGFESAVGVEPSDAMRTVAEEQARRRGIAGLSFVAAGAEEAELGEAAVDLCLICQAFHWMERDVVLERVHRALRPGGGLVVADPGPGHPLELESLSKVMVAYATGGHRPREGMDRHEAVIERSAFGTPERVVIEGDPQSYDADDMIGLLYSTSYCSPGVIGDRSERFEHDVRAAFAQAAGGDERLSCRQDTVLLVCVR